MYFFGELVRSLLRQDFSELSDPNSTWILYFLVLSILFLENGFLPAIFLPGDSLLLLMGILSNRNSINFFLALLLFSISTSLGSWLGYLQGKWIRRSVIAEKWLNQIFPHFYRNANRVFSKHGICALFFGRFFSFFRTLFPIIIGISGMKNIRFQFFNWISSFIWVSILMIVGLLFGKSSIFMFYEKKIVLFLMIFPISFFSFWLFIFLVTLIRRQMKK